MAFLKDSTASVGRRLAPPPPGCLCCGLGKRDLPGSASNFDLANAAVGVHLYTKQHRSLPAHFPGAARIDGTRGFQITDSCLKFPRLGDVIQKKPRSLGLTHAERGNWRSTKALGRKRDNSGHLRGRYRHIPRLSTDAYSRDFD